MKILLLPSSLLQDQLENRKIQLELKIDPKVRDMTGDKKLLTQVIINILNNAMEALPVF